MPRETGSAKRSSPFAQRLAVIALLVLGVPAALVLWVNPVNGAGYLLGQGEPVTVHVTDSSRGTSYSRHSEAGEGYYLRGREREPVRAYGVRGGETVEARLPVIPIGIGVGPVVYVEQRQAIRDVTLGLFGACVVSLIPLFGALGAAGRRARG